MKTFELKITLKVADSLIEEGFNPRERKEQIEDLLSNLLPHAHGHEFVITSDVVSGPTNKEIYRIQGYDVEETKNFFNPQ